MNHTAAYLGRDPAELGAREKRLWALLRSCVLCPHRCRVDRVAGERGKCHTGSLAVVFNYFPHFGEEGPLVGDQGSGAIFFSYCNLACSFCQNWEISHQGEGLEVQSGHLATMMLELQEQGCANINLVTPSHVVPQIVSALRLARQQGLRLPLVYNCGGYERVQTLRELEGLVDIYMPDFKFWSSETAERYGGADDYPERARAALHEMHRQVGDLIIGGDGLAQRGLLVRHLVLPGMEKESEAIFGFLATEISRQTYVNVMDQYHPCGEVVDDPRLGRPLERVQWLRALDDARRAGLQRLDHGMALLP
ncbi:MAG: radical SAM protein [Desulfohalobium sp.]